MYPPMPEHEHPDEGQSTYRFHPNDLLSYRRTVFKSGSRITEEFDVNENFIHVYYYDSDNRHHRGDAKPALVYNPEIYPGLDNEFYYRHGLSHRLDGPSSMSFNGNYHYAIDDIVLTIDEYCAALSERGTPIDKIVMIRMQHV